MVSIAEYPGTKYTIKVISGTELVFALSPARLGTPL